VFIFTFNRTELITLKRKKPNRGKRRAGKKGVKQKPECGAEYSRYREKPPPPWEKKQTAHPLPEQA
jgi:hypothetical protein